MEDVGCPRCKTTKYRKANIKLLVNFCGHALCDSCVELLFAKGIEIHYITFQSGYLLQRLRAMVNIKLKLFSD